MTAIRLEQLGKRFDRTVALDDVCLDIPAGQLLFLLGPSGCGKSTLLRLVAGLIEPSAGRIWFDGRDVTNLPTQQRNAVMCFQSYALWPHLSVRDNIRFGLQVRSVPASEQRRRIDEVLSMVQMLELAHRKPNELSGGQQQRVALARALAVRPACLLLDEPLSNLDAKLRLEMRGEIRRICKQAGLTTVYVTHDQKEALSVADRIAILRDGRLVQAGAPAELYHRPANAFVADFIGQTNLLPGRIVAREPSRLRIATAAGDIWATGPAELPDQIVISIRPERLRLRPAAATAAADNRLPARVVESVFLGESSEHTVLVNGQSVKAVSAPPLLDLPEDLAVEFDSADALALRP